MKEYLVRGVSPLLGLAWIFIGTNRVAPYLSRELGYVMASFYCIHCGFLAWEPSPLGFLEAFCSSMVGALFLWWMQGLILPPLGFFILFPVSCTLHVCLEKRRERLLAVARARASVHV